jgi:hypothetical protein
MFFKELQSTFFCQNEPIYPHFYFYFDLNQKQRKFAKEKFIDSQIRRFTDSQIRRFADTGFMKTSDELVKRNIVVQIILIIKNGDDDSNNYLILL